MKEQSSSEKLRIKSSWWRKISNNKPNWSNGADSEDTGAHDLKTEKNVIICLAFMAIVSKILKLTRKKS